MKYLIPVQALLVFLLSNQGLPAKPADSLTTGADSLQQNIEEGRNLFTGKNRLSGGGPACMSCHSFNDPALPVGGGTLAVNITGFGSLPSDALEERIMESTFPHMAVMKAAYANHPVTKQEANKLIAYLQNASGQQPAAPAPLMAGIDFLWMGLGTCLVILGLIGVSWRRRKKASVNKKIHQRQIQSV